MSCPHWNGALDPCPACECGENVGAGLPEWIGGRIWAEHVEAWLELPVIGIQDQLYTWENDWRGRMGECTRISWVSRDRYWFYGWCASLHAKMIELREAAAKLRRMRRGKCASTPEK